MRLLTGAEAGCCCGAGAGAPTVWWHHIASLLLVLLMLLGSGLRCLELAARDCQPVLLDRWPSQADALCMGGSRRASNSGRTAE